MAASEATVEVTEGLPYAQARQTRKGSRMAVQVFTLTEAQQAYVQQHADLQQLPTVEPERPQQPEQ